MTERKRTPGPWSQYEQDALIIVDKDGASLGDMTPGDPYISNEEALGNALLVVAAPDLVVVAKAILDGGNVVSSDNMLALRTAYHKATA